MSVVANNSHSDILSVLSATKLSSIAEKQQVISMGENDSIKEAFKVLIEKGIHSVPILSSSAPHTCIGLLDVRDFVAYILDLFKGKSEPQSSIQQLSDFSKLNPFIPISQDAFLHDALKTFIENPTLHRVPIVTSDNEIIRMLSHFTVLEWIYENRAKMPSLSKIQVQDMENISLKDVVVARISDKLLEAFSAIVKKKVSALPVLSDEKKIVANLSVTDIKYSIYENLDLLEKPVSVFIEESALRQLTSPITGTKTESLLSIIEKMINKHVHHVWIIDDHDIPIGVVTAFDAIEALLAISVVQVLASELAQESS